MADSKRIKQNTWFARNNHGRVKKSEITKENILDAGVTRLTGLGYTINDGLITTGPTIDTAGSLAPGSFEIGTQDVITAGTASATGGGVVTYEFRFLADSIVVDSTADYTWLADDDDLPGVAQWRAVETGGTNDGATAWQTVGSATITYPAPVAAGGLVDQSFTENTGVQTYDTSGDFTGSDLTFSVNTVTGVSINPSTGVVSFDTDVMALQSLTSITVTATNSGGSDTSGFSLTITAAAAGTLTIDSVSYDRGTAGVAPDLNTTVSETGTTTANYTLYWATRDAANPALSKTNIENGTGDALDNGSVTAATLAALDASLDLSTSLTSDAIDMFVRDSSGTPIESDVATATGVTYDAVAPGFSSAVVENAAPSDLVITLTKATYEAGTLAPADFTLGGTYAGSISTATLTDTTTITLGLSTPVANGDTLTVALTDGAVLVGIDAEAVATWTAQSVTNNVSASYTPETITFDSGDYTNDLALTDGSELVIAVQLQIDDTGTDWWALGPSGDSYIKFESSTNTLDVRVETSTGQTTIITGTSTNVTTNGDTISLFMRARLTGGNLEIEGYIDGTTLSFSDTTAKTGTTLKLPGFINGNGGGTLAGAGTLVGGLWMANTGYSSLSYSDFFDGSDQATFNSATIGGVTARFFCNTVTDMNNGTNSGADGNFTMTGTVT